MDCIFLPKKKKFLQENALCKLCNMGPDTKVNIENLKSLYMQAHTNMFSLLPRLKVYSALNTWKCQEATNICSKYRGNVQ